MNRKKLQLFKKRKKKKKRLELLVHLNPHQGKIMTMMMGMMKIMMMMKII